MTRKGTLVAYGATENPGEVEMTIGLDDEEEPGKRMVNVSVNEGVLLRMLTWAWRTRTNNPLPFPGGEPI